MIVNVAQEMVGGALGGIVDGYLRNKPLADSALTGLVYRASLAFASAIIGCVVGCVFGKTKDINKFAAIARLSCISILALRVGVTFVAFRLGYIGKVVGWAFVGIDVLGTLRGLHKISALQNQYRLSTYVH